MKHIWIYFFSLAFTLVGFSQEVKTDSIVPKKDRYGLRVGADLFKLTKSFVVDDYKGFEIVGDYRFNKKIYIAAEFGNENKTTDEPQLNFTTKGTYLKIGVDFNAYENWLGMENAITIGLRYGFSTFKQELISYRIYTDNPAYPNETIYDPQEFTGLTAHWAELIVGIKTEVLNNLYLSINLQLKRKVAEDKPNNFDNLYIPGYNRTYDYSEFGVGYGYSISYLIPIFKKNKTTEAELK